MIATFDGTFCGHRECNVIPIAETALLYQVEQSTFVARRPIRVRKHFDIVVGDDVGMSVDVRSSLGPTRKTLQAASMLGRRTLGARNEWFVQCASTHGTAKCTSTVFVPCVNYRCRRCTTRSHANWLNERRVKICRVCTKIQKKHLYNSAEGAVVVSCEMGFERANVHNVIEMENIGKCLTFWKL